MKETIVAIATPAGKGGVGIVRVSGGDALGVLQALVPAWPAGFFSHKLRLSRIQSEDGELIDESLAVWMKGPQSYTGEDVVEFQCHGGPIILQRVLEACLAAGARVAHPGEFTQRAYLNGRLDLTQAEAVADLVNATSAAAHKLALEHLRGSLGNLILELRELVIECMVLVESAIDFSHEEHVYQIERDEVVGRVHKVQGELERLRAKFDQGRRQREGVRVVILGPTNAGKSTLFNHLHGTDRAIVTAQAGTTRDFLEEEILLEGVALRIVDTAGLRDTTDEVESIGIERSRQLKTEADLVLWVLDGSCPLEGNTRSELAGLHREGRAAIVVLNKSDLTRGLSAEDQAVVGDFDVVDTALGAPNGAEGVDALFDAIMRKARELTTGEGVLLSRTRHLQSVIAAQEALSRSMDSLDLEMELEIVALDLREALDALGAIVGAVTPDDVLNRIFMEFCVGK